MATLKSFNDTEKKKSDNSWLKPSKISDDIIVETLKKKRKLEKASKGLMDSLFGVRQEREEPYFASDLCSAVTIGNYNKVLDILEHFNSKVDSNTINEVTILID